MGEGRQTSACGITIWCREADSWKRGVCENPEALREMTFSFHMLLLLDWRKG
jgi:hypothetical protein